MGHRCQERRLSSLAARLFASGRALNGLLEGLARRAGAAVCTFSVRSCWVVVSRLGANAPGRPTVRPPVGGCAAAGAGRLMVLGGCSVGDENELVLHVIQCPPGV